MINAKIVGELRAQTGAGMMDCKKALTETNGDMAKAVDWLREKGIAKSAKKAERIAAEGLANIFIEDNNAIILEVNSETDFVSKNEEFTGMIETIGKTILNANVKSLDEALALNTGEGTINDLIISKVARIGEKLSLRRFEITQKSDNASFGAYLHMGGKIAVLTIVEGADDVVAKDIAMQCAAMHPEYLTESDVPSEKIEKEKKILTEEAMNEGKPKEIAEKMVVGRIKKFFTEICLVNQPFIKDGNITVGDYLKNNNGKIIKVIRYEVGEGLEKRSDNFAEEVMNQMNS